jgi:uncharacterized protein YndB with AHSA1/START domain
MRGVMRMTAKKTAHEEREVLVLRRNFPVAPQAVWRAWIDVAALRIWFGQSDAPCWEAELDVRPGGRLRLVMQDAQGNRYEASGVYREVVQERRLVFAWTWKAGAVATEAVITVNLKPTARGTELEFTLDPVIDPRERDAWRADFKRLGVLLQTERTN